MIQTKPTLHNTNRQVRMGRTTRDTVHGNPGERRILIANILVAIEPASNLPPDSAINYWAHPVRGHPWPAGTEAWAEDVGVGLRIDAKHSNEDQIAPFDQWIDLYGERIGLFGGIDVNTLCRNKYEDVYREVLEKGTRFRNRARGYGIGSGNSIPEYVPVEGFMAMIDAVKEIRSRESR